MPTPYFRMDKAMSDYDYDLAAQVAVRSSVAGDLALALEVFKLAPDRARFVDAMGTLYGEQFTDGGRAHPEVMAAMLTFLLSLPAPRN